MLIDLIQRLTINPSQYPTTLVVRLDTNNRPECGVFAGSMCGFDPAEEGLLVPQILTEDDEVGFHDYIIDRPRGNVQEHQSLRYYYAVVGWSNSVYVQMPVAWELTFIEEYGEKGTQWSAAFAPVTGLGLTLVLPDYTPGYRARNGI
jgi:hypothetical protein